MTLQQEQEKVLTQQIRTCLIHRPDSSRSKPATKALIESMINDAKLSACWPALTADDYKDIRWHLIQKYVL
jgi:hypothetical protein